MTMLRVTHDTEFLVAEMGASAAGDIARLVALARPDVGVVLKVGLAHAGGFGSIEGTTKAKSEMVTDLLETDVAVLNRDDPRVAGMAELTRARVAWFGLAADPATGGTSADDVEASASGTTFELQLPGGERRRVAFRVLGEHHVSNAMAAAAVATALGVDADTIVAGLEAVVRAERWRMEVARHRPRHRRERRLQRLPGLDGGGAEGAGPDRAGPLRRRAGRDDRARRVRGGGARPRRPARRPAERRPARRGRPGREAHPPRRDRAGLLGRREPLRGDAGGGGGAARASAATRRHRAGQVVELGRPPPPRRPPRRPLGREPPDAVAPHRRRVSLLFTLFLTPLFIRLFHRLQWGQFIRDDGPVSHHAKRGTATMGGVVFILASVVGYFAGHLNNLRNITVSGLLVLFLMVGLGARRLRRRLPEDPEPAQPRARRLGEDRRSGDRRDRLRAARAPVPAGRRWVRAARWSPRPRRRRTSRSSATSGSTARCSASPPLRRDGRRDRLHRLDLADRGRRRRTA